MLVRDEHLSGPALSGTFIALINITVVTTLGIVAKMQDSSNNFLLLTYRYVECIYKTCKRLDWKS